MTEPKQTPTQPGDEAKEHEPELERETLKDLTPQDEQAEGVKGGPTLPGRDCECGTM